MQTHDFVCFIQRNGQVCHLPELLVDDNPESLEEPDSPERADTAIIVIIPNKINPKDLDTTDFAQYPKIEVAHSGEWDFEGIDGYAEVLQGKGDKSIWTHPSYPGKWLVNFEKTFYRIFVTKEIPLKLLSYQSYRTILEARQIETESTNKELLWRMVARAYNKNIPPLNSLDQSYLDFHRRCGKELIGLIAQYALPTKSDVVKVLTSNLDVLKWVRVHNVVPTSWRDIIMPRHWRGIVVGIKPGMFTELYSNWHCRLSNQELLDLILWACCGDSGYQILSEIRSLLPTLIAQLSNEFRVKMINSAKLLSKNLWELGKHWNCYRKHVSPETVKEIITFNELASLKVLYQLFWLDIEYIRKCDPKMTSLESVARNNHFEMIALLRTIGLTSEDVNQSKALGEARRFNRAEALKELLQFFQIGTGGL